jgi:chaperonin GroES
LGVHAAMKIRPLGNRVLVQRSKGKSAKGGILLPDAAQEKPKEGEVLAVGPGKANDKGQIEPMHVKVGDKVLFGSYAGVEVKGMDQDGEYLILTEDEILGILS